MNQHLHKPRRISPPHFETEDQFGPQLTKLQNESAQVYINRVTISIVMATLNSGRELPRLIESLLNQTDRDFELSVCDGGSSDNTIELLREIVDFPVRLVSERDRGPGDATNKAIKQSSGDYFLIVGSDDYLDYSAIKNFKSSILKHKVDITVAKVISGSKILHFKRPSWIWLYGAQAKIGSTAIGMCMSRHFFMKVGGFPTMLFPVAADGYFAIKALKMHPSIYYEDFIAGEFNGGGMSNKNIIVSHTENFCVQVIHGGSFFVQLLLLNLRLLKAYLTSRKRLRQLQRKP